MAYANIDTRVELNRRASGAIDLVCRFCKKSLHEHEKERVVPDDGKGPAGAWHYRYRCDDGFRPQLDYDGGDA